MQLNKIKGRGGVLGEINGDIVTVRKGFLKGKISFNKSEISSMEIKKCIYDLPFLEKTLIFRVGNKQYKLKRLPAKQISQFQSSLI